MWCGNEKHVLVGCDILYFGQFWITQIRKITSVIVESIVVYLFKMMASELLFEVSIMMYE